jgi:hypothetical protein
LRGLLLLFVGQAPECGARCGRVAFSRSAARVAFLSFAVTGVAAEEIFSTAEEESAMKQLLGGVTIAIVIAAVPSFAGDNNPTATYQTGLPPQATTPAAPPDRGATEGSGNSIATDPGTTSSKPNRGQSAPTASEPSRGSVGERSPDAIEQHEGAASDH